jgi:hypothetical protein
MNYEWKDPEPRAGRGVSLITSELLKLLQSNPGKWLSVGVQNRSSWSRSVNAGFKNQIQLTSRNQKGPFGEVFLRWIADEVEDE